MANTYVTETLTGATFYDKTTHTTTAFSGTWLAEYDSSGNLISIYNPSFTITPDCGTATTWDCATPSGTRSAHQIQATGSSSTAYSKLNIGYSGETPTTLAASTTSVFNAATGNTDTLQKTGTITSSADKAVTTTIKDAVFANGATLTGTWTAIYNAAGVLEAVENATFTVTGTNGLSNTFTSAGTLPYADTASGSSYEIHFDSVTGRGDFNSLYVDWKTETPTAFFQGTQSLYTSVKENCSDPIRLVKDGSTTAPVEPVCCFLRGTLIATPSGDVAVEALGVGDVVSVLEDGNRVGRPLVWAGRGRMDAAVAGYADDAFPVRIRRHAFAPNVPARDLLVTPEHCILTAAGLTPARMLVNGASILIDRSLPEYEFFHVELETHGILLSEGLATESYLDTGNRGLFEDGLHEAGQASGNVLRGPTMAAPLAVARAVVEPIWRELADRAAGLGFEGLRDAPVCTSQPDLRLLLEDGAEIGCAWMADRHYMFQIPRHARVVGLLSRSAVPAQLIGPFVDDRRSLGVAVEKLVLWSGLDETVLPVADLALDGWYGAEGGVRWTNGQAALDLPAASETTYLDVHLAATMLYAEQLLQAA